MWTLFVISEISILFMLQRLSMESTQLWDILTYLDEAILHIYEQVLPRLSCVACLTERPLISPEYISTVITYNGLHNFPLFLVFSSLIDNFSLLILCFVWIRHLRLFSAIQSHCSCQRDSGSLEAPWCGRKVSQGGGRGKRKRPYVFTAPTPTSSFHYYYCSFSSALSFSPFLSLRTHSISSCRNSSINLPDCWVASQINEIKKAQKGVD